MAGLARLTTWVSDQTLTAAALNGEFDNIIDTIEASDFAWTGTHSWTGTFTVGSDIISDLDSTDDLGSATIRWANVYTDSIGDSGQTLDVGSATLSFDAAATIDTSGNNDLTLDAGTSDLVITASDILPTNDNSTKLGSSTKRFTDLYLADEAQIHWNGGTQSLKVTNSGNTWLFENSTGVPSVIFKASGGPATPDGTMHIWSGNAGTITASADADELVLENSGNTGLSILSASTFKSNLYFGNDTTNVSALIQYWAGFGGGPQFKLGTSVANGFISFVTGNEDQNAFLDSSGNFTLGGISAPGGSPANVLTLANGTLGSATADHLQITSEDLSALNTTLAIQSEGTGTSTDGTTLIGTGTPTANRTVNIKINGTTYALIASTSFA